MRTCRGSTARGSRRASTTLAEEVAFGRAWQAKLAGGPLGRRHVARGVRRPRRRPAASTTSCRRSCPGAGARARRAHRHQPRRPHAARARHRRPEGALAPADPRRRARSGASCSASPGRAATSRRCRTAPSDRRGPGDGGWVARTVRRSGRRTHSSPTGACASRAPIPTRRSTRACRPRRRHALAGRRGAAAAPDHRRGRVQRGVLRRRVRPTTITSSVRSTAAGRSRTPRSPTNEVSTRASSSMHSQLLDELCEAGARARRARRPPPLAAPRGGVRRGAPLPTPQLAVDLPHSRKGLDPGPRGLDQQAVVERDEQAAARHRVGRTRLGCAALAGCDRTTPATAHGSARGSTTRRRRSGPAPTRSSATSSASACWACPRRPKICTAELSDDSI